MTTLTAPTPTQVAPPAASLLTPRFTAAFAYAAALHGKQTRKGASATGERIPYLAHLMGVAAIVLEYGGTEDEAIAALLHDAVEDQGGQITLDTIHNLYGPEVAQIVEGCTDGVPDSNGKKEKWRTRKERYIAHLPDACGSVRLVSAADKLYNVRTLIADYRAVGEQLWQRFRGGRDTLWYYVALCSAFDESLREGDPAGLPALVAELKREVHALHKMANS